MTNRTRAGCQVATARKRVLATVCTVLASLPFIASVGIGEVNDPQTPKLVPAGWVWGFDYESSLTAYLRQLYQDSRLRKQTLYVYFYDDSDSHCLRVRELAEDDDVREAFLGTHIVMLDYDRLSRFYRKETGEELQPLGWTPLIAKISSDGSMVDEDILLPDLPLFHQRLINDVRYDYTGSSRQIKKQLFSRWLKEYFQKHNEDADGQ